MDNELEVIRDEMEQTRANLAEKLGALENQVRETVSGATEAVNSTVEGVKEVASSVSETVETVSEAFNVSKQVERRPWTALAAATATGFVLAQVLNRASQPEQPVQSVQGMQGMQTGTAAPRQEEPGVLDSLGSMLPDMSGVANTLVSSLGGLAVGSVMGLIRELASSELPKEWHGEVTKLIDEVTTKLGGEPLDSGKSGQLFSFLGLDGHSTQRNGGSSSSTAGVKKQVSDRV